MEQQVDYRHTIDAPLDLVWAVVSDFGSLLRWLPNGERGSLLLHGEGIGSTRDLDLPSVGKVQHRLDALDPTAHSLTYSLTRGRPLGMRRYRVTLSLAGDEEHCVIHWHGEFDPESGADTKAMAAGLVGAYEGMSRALDELLEGWQDHG